MWKFAFFFLSIFFISFFFFLLFYTEVNSIPGFWAPPPLQRLTNHVGQMQLSNVLIDWPFGHCDQTVHSPPPHTTLLVSLRGFLSIHQQADRINGSDWLAKPRSIKPNGTRRSGREACAGPKDSSGLNNWQGIWGKRMTQNIAPTQREAPWVKPAK